MAHWALGAHPENYRILDSVLELDEEWWRTGDRPLAVGDRVAIFKFKGRERVRGVIALGEVLTDPVEMNIPPEDEPYALPSSRRPPAAVAPRVLVRYVRPPRLPIWMEEQPASVVNELSVTRAQGGTAFRITDEQWSRLLVEVGGWPAPAPATDAVAAVVEQVVRGHPHGQGFGLDAQQRRAVELRAMEVTRAEFVSRGWEVSDVSATSPYDLLCRLGSELRRVEVKGTTGPPVAVLLTKNEVIAAQADPASAVLAIVHGIKLKVSSGGVTADEGQLLIIEPWHLNNADLMALAYRYTVPAI